MKFAGEIAALATAVGWSANSVCFSLAGRRVGSSTVNVVRLAMAFVGMLALHLVLVGTLFPVDAGLARFAWLGTSGLIGFALGDALLFEALVRLGPRPAMLVMTLWPAFSALLARAFLGESLSAGKLAAMLVTLGGIALVVAKPDGAGGDLGGVTGSARGAGLLLALGGAVGQAVGFLFSKIGMAGGFSPVSANVIRVSAGIVALALWQGLRGELASNFGRLRDLRSTWLIAAGALTGPIFGVVMSLYAAAHSRYLGVASTLMSLSPVILLPVSARLFGERIGGRAIGGTIVTMAGAAALFLF